MAFSTFVARLACVGHGEGCSMSPAVGTGTMRVGHCVGGFLSLSCEGFLGALGRIFVDAKLVGCMEMNADVGHCLLGFSKLLAPFVQSLGEESAVLEVCND